MDIGNGEDKPTLIIYSQDYLCNLFLHLVKCSNRMDWRLIKSKTRPRLLNFEPSSFETFEDYEWNNRTEDSSMWRSVNKQVCLFTILL